MTDKKYKTPQMCDLDREAKDEVDYVLEKLEGNTAVARLYLEEK